MESAQLLGEAATFTAGEIDCGFDVAAIQEGLNAFGANLIPLLRTDDAPGVFAPVIFTVEGKHRGGCVLTVGDRAVFVWQAGRLRLKAATAVVPFDEVADSRISARASDDPSKPLVELVIVAAQTWTLAVPQATTDRPQLFDHITAQIATHRS